MRLVALAALLPLLGGCALLRDLLAVSYEPPQATYRGGSRDSTAFGRVAKIYVDPETEEAYIADGYLNPPVVPLLFGHTDFLKFFTDAEVSPSLRITIVSDSANAAAPGSSFTGQGMPLRRTQWVENGTLSNLVYSRFWAQKQGKEPIGNPDGYSMSGGSSTVEEMIRSTERGLLVTRLWYIRPVDQRTILYTGKGGVGKTSVAAATVPARKEPMIGMNAPRKTMISPDSTISLAVVGCACPT